MIFSLAWNTMFTEYGKALVLNFSEMGNTFYPRAWQTWFLVQCIIPKKNTILKNHIEIMYSSLSGD